MLKIDEEFKSLIHPLTKEEFDQLKQNIISDGCREPLVVWNGTIVDGHNRYMICSENNINFDTAEKDFSDRQQAREWIILNQFGRRNLSPMQRSELALKLKPVIAEKAKVKETERKTTFHKSKKSNIEPVDTAKEVAKIAGVSPNTIYKTEKILEKGTLEQIDRARKGGKGNSVNAVYSEIKSENQTKECRECHRILPLEKFYKGKSICRICISNKPKSSVMRDVKGNKLEISEEYKHLTEEEIIGDLYDTEKVRTYDINDLIEEFSGNFQNYSQILENILHQHKDLIKDKENNKKIMVALSEAVTTMKKMKGNYSYGEL